ncbi:MAG: UDP-2,3-diacylglucosamine diphosphatase LpxI [Pseudomonadota bacterium]
MSKLALIAGQGDLPARLASVLGRAGRPWFACHLDGFLPSGVGQSRGFRIETLGTFLADLRTDGTTEVCFAGKIARPPLDPTAVDAQTMPLVPRMMQALQAGDDAALRIVITFFEEAGIRVIGAHEVDHTLLEVPEVGTPSDQDVADIARAAAVHTALSALDIGQALVVARGQVLGIEALPGTDHMLACLAKGPPRPPQSAPSSGGLFGGDLFGGAADWLSGPGAGSGAALPDFVRPKGGLLFKAAKAGQDLRIDMPAIGAETVTRAAAAGLDGIVVERGAVLVLDGGDVAARAEQKGLFLKTWTRP